MRLYGADLTKRGPLFIADDGAAKPKVRRTVRIGVTAARDKRWRFVVAGSPFITRPRLDLTAPASAPTIPDHAQGSRPGGGIFQLSASCFAQRTTLAVSFSGDETNDRVVKRFLDFYEAELPR